MPEKISEKTRIALIVFVGTTSIALLSFIALPLGVMGFCIFSAGVILYTERRRRNFWERAAAAKFIRLKDELEKLALRVDLNKNSIAALKAAQEKKPATHTPKTEKKQAPPPHNLSDTIKSYHHTKDMEDEYDFISDIIVKELVRNATTHERIEIFVQPVVRLPQRQTRFYELYARIRARPGLYLPAQRYMDLAREDKLHNVIDTLLLLHSLKTIENSAHLEKAAPFFLNITNDTLRNGKFMKRLLAFLSHNRHLAPRLIFELRQDDFGNLPPACLEILKGLGTLGCALSLDHVTTYDFDLADLLRFKIRFIKLDANTLKNAVNTPAQYRTLKLIKRKLEGNGIGIIGEKIETEEDMRKLLDLDLHYGQGYLFGKPDLQGAYKSRTRIRRRAANE